MLRSDLLSRWTIITREKQVVKKMRKAKGGKEGTNVETYEELPPLPPKMREKVSQRKGQAMITDIVPGGSNRPQTKRVSP